MEQLSPASPLNPTHLPSSPNNHSANLQMHPAQESQEAAQQPEQPVVSESKESTHQNHLPRREDASADVNMHQSQQAHSKQQKQSMQKLIKPAQSQPELEQPKFNHRYDPSQINLHAYQAPHPDSLLSQALSKLPLPNTDSVDFLNSLLKGPNEQIPADLVNYAQLVFGSILKSLDHLFRNREDYSPGQLVAQVSLLSTCVKCWPIVHNVGELLTYAINFGITQLIHDNENSAEIAERLKSRNVKSTVGQTQKPLNDLLIKIIKLVHPHKTVNVLLELLTYHSAYLSSPPRIITLILKCLERVADKFPIQINFEAIQLFLLKAEEYMSVHDLQPIQKMPVQKGPQVARPQETMSHQERAVKVIQQILTKVYKKIGQQFWEHYPQSLKDVSVFHSWVKGVVEPIQDASPPEDATDLLLSENTPLQVIDGLLSHRKSFEEGVAHLGDYASAHPGFNIEQFLKQLGYHKKFIRMIMEVLSESDPSRYKRKEEEQPKDESQEGEKPKDERKEGEESGVSRVRALQIRRRIEAMMNKQKGSKRGNTVKKY